MLQAKSRVKTYTLCRLAFLPAVLVIAGLARMAEAQNRTNVAKNGCFAKDATINYAVAGDAAVGFAVPDDIDAKRNPFSPAVRFIAGSSVNGTMLVLNRSRVTISGIKITTDLVANDGSVLVFSGGDVGGSVLAQNNSTISVTGGSVGNGLFASDATTVNLSGGSVVVGLVVEKRGTFNISGGRVGGKSYVNDTGVMNFAGSGLRKTLADPTVTWQGISYSQYTLSGKLRDGTSVSGRQVFVQNKSGAKLILNNAPVAAAPAVPPSGKMRPAH